MLVSLLVFLLFIGGTNAAGADRIELETGEVFAGKILRISKSEVSIELASGGILSFRLAHVRRIRKYSGKGEDGEESILVYERPGLAEKKGGAVAAPRTEGPSTSPGDASPREPGFAERELLSDRGKEKGETGENTITDQDNTFAVAPPKGLMSCPDLESETVPFAFKDPFTQASFTISVYPSSDSILDIKNAALRSFTEQFTIFRVIRDEKLKRNEKEAFPEAWLVEIETRLGSVRVHQVQAFSKSGQKAIVLTYSASEENYPRHKAAFEKSLQSFRCLEPARKAPSKTSASP